MNLKNFVRKYNGWLGFVVASVLFFVAPHIYRLFDPTAGQFDAGYIHPIIYAFVVVSFASGLSWTLVLITAPGPHKYLDRFFECGPENGTSKFDFSDAKTRAGIFVGLGLFLFIMFAVILLVACIG